MDTILKDYCAKIEGKIPTNYGVTSTDVNNLVCLLNFSFQTKNDFFVTNFNRKTVKSIHVGYNQMKTNILTPEIKDVLHNIEVDSLKSLRFIVSNYINVYNTITDNKDNIELCEQVTPASMRNVLVMLNHKINAAL